MAWAIRGSNPRMVERSLQNVQGCSEPHPFCYSLGSKGSFYGHKAPDIVPLSLKMSGSIILSPTPTLPYSVMACTGETFYLTYHLQQSFTVERWVDVMVYIMILFRLNSNLKVSGLRAG